MSIICTVKVAVFCDGEKGIWSIAVQLAYQQWAPRAGIPASRFVHQDGESFGASGAILGIIGYVAARLPNMTIEVVVIPMQAMWFVPAALAASVFFMVDSGPQSYGHAAHAGGLLAGVAAGLMHVRLRR
jgi:membrane associated rhomboid family serine protease